MTTVVELAELTQWTSPLLFLFCGWFYYVSLEHSLVAEVNSFKMNLKVSYA